MPYASSPVLLWIVDVIHELHAHQDFRSRAGQTTRSRSPYSAFCVTWLLHGRILFTRRSLECRLDWSLEWAE